jgi:hypothetical protein
VGEPVEICVRLGVPRWPVDRSAEMAGRPKRRLALSQLQQQLLARDDPRVLPAGFRDWPRDRQLEWILNANLVQVATVCTWPVSELDMGRLAIWDRVRHGIWRLGERRLSDAVRGCAARPRHVLGRPAKLSLDLCVSSAPTGKIRPGANAKLSWRG